MYRTAVSEYSDYSRVSRPGLRRSHSYDSLINRRSQVGNIDYLTQKRTGQTDPFRHRARDDLRRRDMWEIERQREKQVRLQEWERSRARERERVRRSRERELMMRERERLREDERALQKERFYYEKEKAKNFARAEERLLRATEGLERLALDRQSRHSSGHSHIGHGHGHGYGHHHHHQPHHHNREYTRSLPVAITTTSTYASSSVARSPSPYLPEGRYQTGTSQLANPTFPMSTKGRLMGYHILQILGPLVIPTRLPAFATPSEIQQMKQRFLNSMMREAAKSGGNGIVNFGIEEMGAGLYIGKGTVVSCVPDEFSNGMLLGRERVRVREERRVLESGGVGGGNRLLLGY